MPVKISGVRKLNKDLSKILPNARSRFAKEMKRTIVDIIVEKIVSGLSPVKGFGRFKKYSDSYEKIKGRSAPVDLVKSGDMLENMRARQTNKGAIVIEFTDATQRKKAEGHNRGNRKKNLPKRRILPTGTNETFKTDILNKIVKIVEKAIGAAIK